MLTASAARAAVAEVAWPTSHGAIGVSILTPLESAGTVCFALPFADTELALALQAAGRAVVVVSDSRLALRGWQPLTAAVSLTVRADLDGDWLTTDMLEQLLRKQPPARRLLDTPLERREHWWYVPRWIVRVDGPPRVSEVGRREPDDGVLLADTGQGLRADTVRVGDWEADTVVLESLAGRRLWPGPCRAVLCTHDFSVPDLERRSQFVVRGRLNDGRLQVDSRHGSRELPPPPSLRARLRDARALRRRCRRYLSEWRA